MRRLCIRGTLMHRTVFSLQLCYILLLVPAAQALDATWEHKTFSHPDEVVSYFRSINYSLSNWRSGDRSVPRVYLTHIPARWRSDYAGAVATPVKKRYFFFILAPMVLRANETIAEQRAFLIALRAADQWQPAERERLAGIAAEYRLPAPADRHDTEAFTRLLRRVDVVPASLAMAQAAIESGWGTSRFASEGNALFGQWTWDDNAIKPERVRTELGNYGIRAFSTPFESICAYMHNLNTHRAYRILRDLRAQARQQQRPLAGSELAAGLMKYSERGADYVGEIRALIRINHLADVDSAYLRKNRPVRLEPVGNDT